MADASFSFFTTPGYKWAQSLTTGLFLYLFLVAFLPFGISNYNPNHEYTLKFLFEIAIFGGFTIAISALNEFGVKRFLPSPVTWKAVIIWWIWSLVFLGLCLYVLYNFLGGWHDWSAWRSVKFILEVSMVLVFPFAGVFFFYNYRSLQQDYNDILISRGPANTDMLYLEGQGNREKLTVPVMDFIYAQAQDNYVEINYMLGGQIENALFRTTLGSLEQSSGHDYIVRCHRSFLINALAVHSIHGGKNDLRVCFEQNEISIPVTRTYADRVIDVLKKYKQFGH